MVFLHGRLSTTLTELGLVGYFFWLQTVFLPPVSVRGFTCSGRKSNSDWPSLRLTGEIESKQSRLNWTIVDTVSRHHFILYWLNEPEAALNCNQLRSPVCTVKLPSNTRYAFAGVWSATLKPCTLDRVPSSAHGFVSQTRAPTSYRESECIHTHARYHDTNSPTRILIVNAYCTN